MALLHPLVSFSLTDTSDQTSGIKRLLVVSRSKEGCLGRWRQLWGRAGVENTVEFEEKEVTNGDDVKLSAHGFFSLAASHSKASQFICTSLFLPS